MCILQAMFLYQLQLSYLQNQVHTIIKLINKHNCIQFLYVDVVMLMNPPL